MKLPRLKLALLASLVLCSVAGSRFVGSAQPKVNPHRPAASAGSVELGFEPPELWFLPMESGDNEIQLCQATAPVAAPPCAQGPCGGPGCQFVTPCGPAFHEYGPGEYVARARTQHVPDYFLRVDDEIEFVFRVTRHETGKPYRIQVGDELRVESVADEKLDRTLIVQPDGTISLRGLGQLRVSRRTVTEVRDEVESLYEKLYKVPAISVTPTKVNTRLEDIRATVDSRSGFGGQSKRGKITPEGTVSIPVVGSVPAQGLTLEELKREIDARFLKEVEGIEVTPLLVTRAPRYVYVLGEVTRPGQYTLNSPTTVMQAISMAGGWTMGANLNEIVVMRRSDDWRMIAAKLDLRQALLGKQPCPGSEIWMSDADLVIVPKSKLLLTDNFIDMVFTRGLYRVLPFSTSLSFTNLSSIQ